MPAPGVSGSGPIGERRLPGEPVSTVVVRLRCVAQPSPVWAPLDAFLYNVMTTNVVVLCGLLAIAGAAFYFPASSLVAAILIAGIFCIAEASIYAFLVSSMPRNGGDYVYQSRLISKWLGATLALTGVVAGGALWMAIAGWLASRVAIGPFLILLGGAVHVVQVVRAGEWVMSPSGVVALGILATVWSAVLNTMGLEAYARLQRLLTAAGLVALAVLIAYFALTRLNVNESDYSGLLSRAQDLGYRRAGHQSGLGASMKLLPVVAVGLIYPGWIAYQAGELKRASSLTVQTATIVGAKIASVLFALALLPLAVSHVGEQLLGAGAFLAIHDPRAFRLFVPRVFGITAEPWVAWIIMTSAGVAVNAWLWIWVPNHTLAASRVLQAMASDRMLPHWMSRLSARHAVPVGAILAFSAVCLPAIVAFARVGLWNFVVYGTFVSLLTFAGTCAAAALCPFISREFYRESTAARFELLAVPLVTILGTAYVGFAGFLGWQYARFEPLLEANGVGALLTALGLLYAVSLVTCVAWRWYRRGHEGANVEIYYRHARGGAVDGR
jgi:amino acid transporter